MRLLQKGALRLLARAAALLADCLMLIVACGVSASVACAQSQTSPFAPQWQWRPRPSSPMMMPSKALPPSQTPLPGSVIVDPPMRFVQVVSAAETCHSNCPEWVSAEGQIEAGTAQTFVRFIASLGGRRLPILINSHGGSASDAIAMGRLIRAQRLVVATAHTELSPCPTAAPNCSPTPGVATASQALCLSACTLVLAGGVERYVDIRVPVGVHQVKLGLKPMVLRRYLVKYQVVDGKRQEISRTLTSQERFEVSPDATDLAKADASVASYLKEMGVGEPLMSLTQATPPSGIHVMTYDELVASRLATMWVYVASFGIQPDGLTGIPIGSSAQSAGTVAFTVKSPILGGIDGRDYAFTALFQHRPGGGAISAKFTLIDADGSQRPGVGSYVLSGGKNPLVEFEGSKLVFLATGWIPRDVFCRLSGERRAFAEFAEPSFAEPDERRREHLARIDFASAPGAAALFADACPTPVAVRR